MIRRGPGCTSPVRGGAGFFRRPSLNSRAFLARGGAFGHIDKDGEWVIGPRFADAEPLETGLPLVAVSDGSWSYIDTSGRLIFP